MRTPIKIIQVIILLIPLFILSNSEAGLVGTETSHNSFAPMHAMTSNWNYGSADVGKDYLIGGSGQIETGSWKADKINTSLGSVWSGKGSIGKYNGNVGYGYTALKYVMVASPSQGGVEGVLINEAGSTSSFTIPVSSGSGYFSCRPAAYSNGDKFLVVWEERKPKNGADNDSCDDAESFRDAFTKSYAEEIVQSNIYGAFVSNAGAVSTPFIISSLANIVQLRPDVSSKYYSNSTVNNSFFVAWSRLTNEQFSASTSAPPCDANNRNTCPENLFPIVYGNRIDPNGNLLYPGGGIKLSSTYGTQWLPKISWNNNNYLVIWEGSFAGFTSDESGNIVIPQKGESSIIGARIQDTGTSLNVLDPDGFLIGYFRGSGAFQPGIAWNGKYHQVVWADLRNDSDVRKSNTFSLGPPSSINSTTTDNSGLSSLEFDIYGARVKADNSSYKVLDPEGFIVHKESGPDYFPAVAWNGSSFAAGWTNHLVPDWRDTPFALQRFNFFYNISPSRLPRAIRGEVYSQTLSVAECFENCGASYTWSVDETDWDGFNTTTDNTLVSAGLTLNATTGLLTGIGPGGVIPVATTAGVKMLRIKATSGTNADYREYRLIVADSRDNPPQGCFIATAAAGLDFLILNYSILEKIVIIFVLAMLYIIIVRHNRRWRSVV